MTPRTDLELFALVEASHDRQTGRRLVGERGDLTARARWLYEEAPFAVLAHDAGEDPRFVYANCAAQRAFDSDWDGLVGLPSRLSAPPAGRDDRQDLLDRARRDGYADGYRGVRVTRTGRRFWIEDATLWDVDDGAGARIGQAVRIAAWTAPDR